MKVKLESLSDKGLQHGYSLKYFKKGEVVDALFGQFGVKLLIDGNWFLFDFETIGIRFKVYGQ